MSRRKDTSLSGKTAGPTLQAIIQFSPNVTFWPLWTPCPSEDTQLFSMGTLRDNAYTNILHTGRTKKKLSDS